MNSAETAEDPRASERGGQHRREIHGMAATAGMGENSGFCRMLEMGSH